MNFVVKITKDDDGDKIPYAKWCFVINTDGCNRTLCSGQAFGLGESDAEYKTRDGKVTCDDCIALIKHIKTAKY